MLVTEQRQIVLVGLESVGKTAIFRLLTGENCGDERNVRGSTISVRQGSTGDSCIFDIPGIRVASDSYTTELALKQIDKADTVMLIVRATHAGSELKALLKTLGKELRTRQMVLILTFADRVGALAQTVKSQCEKLLGVPVFLVNARHSQESDYQEIISLIEQAKKIPYAYDLNLFDRLENVDPKVTVFEDRRFGGWLSVIGVVAMFALPVYLAYIFSNWLQPIADDAVITPLKNWLGQIIGNIDIFKIVFIGDYGLLTLGWYSFLWAFPVVLLMGISVAICEETGLKDRMTAALDPHLKHIGLSGRDLVPVLTGFGCNVVAVMQTRACSRCTRANCLAMITFASACSYQIGATLSVFSSAGHPALFFPYLLVLFLVGAVHTRIWHGSLSLQGGSVLSERAFLQWPTVRGMLWRIKTSVLGFLTQAMPIFLGICAVAALLQYWGVVDHILKFFAPVMSIFNLPLQAASGIIFAMIRKDGLLVLNQDNGAFIHSLKTGQVFVLVYLASTLTACLVTLWTIKKEMGLPHALKLMGRQVTTSLVSALLISWVVRL